MISEYYLKLCKLAEVEPLEDSREQYERICKKLGDEPKNIEIPCIGYEDDSYISPIQEKLTMQERVYLQANGYFKYSYDEKHNNQHY